MNKLYLYIGIGVVVVVTVFGVMYLFRPTSTVTPVTDTSGFGVGQDRPGTTPGSTTSDEVPAVSDNGTNAANKIIFKLLEGPVAGATLLQMGRPTTTVARFVLADSGRVFDLPLDVPGAVARVVSNTTIPGIQTVLWTAGDKAAGTMGDGVVLQYVDNTTIKTLHIAFPAATSTLGSQAPAKVTFLPDGITNIAVAPDGKSVAFLLKTSTGSDGYRAAPNGTGAQKIFSLPLTQLLIGWPSPNALLVQTPAAAGVPGVVFSINATTGAVEPLLYAEGVVAAADRQFSKVVYQTASASSRSTYARDIKTGLSTPLSFDPFPERCIWSPRTAAGMYCATPLTYVPSDFLDQWHAGVASAVDSIFAFNVATGRTTVVAAPGSSDGGEQADIAMMAVSPDEHYLIYVRKGDRSLWGVRLGQ